MELCWKMKNVVTFEGKRRIKLSFTYTQLKYHTHLRKFKLEARSLLRLIMFD